MSELDQEKLQLYKQLQPAILRLQKGDVLVISTVRGGADPQIQKIKDAVAAVLKQAGHDPEETPVVVLTEGVELQVLRKEEEESS